MGFRSSAAGQVPVDRSGLNGHGAVFILRLSRRNKPNNSVCKMGEARLLILAGLNAPVFLVTSNFDVIKTYNNSTAYALSVGLLGEGVTGGTGLAAQWPTTIARSLQPRSKGFKSN